MNQYIGIPFIDGGRNSEGCDCWGLVKLIYENELGIELPDFNISALDTPAVIEAMDSGKRKQWRDTSLEPEKYDVVALHIGQKHFNMVNHVGIYMGNGMFIHTLQRTASMMNRMGDAQWKSRVLGVYRWVV